MTERLLKVTKLFERYYNLKLEEVDPPFDAEAVFESLSEQYFLTKSARLSEVKSNEYVYLKEMENLDEATLNALSQIAWERGIAHAAPDFTHQNTDATLILLAERVDPAAKALIPGFKYYKSYMYRLQGWSDFRLVVIEQNTNTVFSNRKGQELAKLVRNIL